MSIKDIPEKIKSYWQDNVLPIFNKIKENLDLPKDIFIVLVIILVGLAGFGLGKLSALEKDRGEVEIKPADFITNISSTSDDKAKGMLVASKSGTKYHFPWCAGASQISDKNKIWFNSYEEAQKAGYTPASNCKGLI